jgi:hypothetical protein
MTTILILSVGVALIATVMLLLLRSQLKKQGRQATK